MDNGRNFFAFVSRMKYITRWGLMRNNINENIQEHSLDVAIIAHALAVINNVYLAGNINAELVAVLGIFHDTNEIITGDMPTPVKYFNPEIHNAYKDIENISKLKLLNMLPHEMKKVYEAYFDISEVQPEINRRIIKAADKIAAYIKCIQERKSGNDEFLQAEKALLTSINEMDLPEVKYFMDIFLPAYQLTLDEINT